MTDAIISIVVERIATLLEEQIRHHVNLVRGAEKEVLKLSGELKTIKNVLDDAENRRFKDKNINSWLSRLEQTSYQMEDVLDEWDFALLKLKIEGHHSDDVVAPPKQKVFSFIPSSSCLCFKKTVVRHHVASKILNVKAQLDEILKEKDRYGFVISQPRADPVPEPWRIQSTSFIDFAKVHGRDRDRDILVSKLTNGEGGSQEESGIQVVSIVGVGGLGKTTLAQLVYNHSRVEKSFDLRIWVCVSDPFDLASIAKEILESVRIGSSSNTDQLDVLLKHVKESILGRRFLLVLDDIWTEDDSRWEPLESSLSVGGTGSKILVTTRSERVAKMIGSRDSEIYHLGLLSDDDCWLLLCRMALSGQNKVEFEGLGKKIAQKCNGLPLAVKTMGSLLRYKSRLEEWENVLKSEVWKMDEAEVNIFPHLLLSYNELSPTQKRCFSYCAVFPKDSKIVVGSLIENWMALGYLGTNVGDMELIGRECFDVLAMRSLFQDFSKDYMGEIESCKMHDIVHDFAQFLRKSGRVEATLMKKTICQACDPLLVSTVNEFCTFYCVEKHSLNPCDCLVRLRVLSLTGVQRVPQGMGNLFHLRCLKLYNVENLPFEDLKIIFQLYNLQTLCLFVCNLEEIPREIGNLINLRRLSITGNESLKELPREIGNLILLKRLDLRGNGSLKELPTEIGNLVRLRYLGLIRNKSLEGLPESISKLQKLQTLDVSGCSSLCQLPAQFAKLTGLRSLDQFRGGSGWNKFGLLKNLNQLGGYLRLRVRLAAADDLEGMVEDAQEAELKNKNHIKRIDIKFEDELNEKKPSSSSSSSSSLMRMDLIDALQPHPNVRELVIQNYMGSKFPQRWCMSPLSKLIMLKLESCSHLTSLPCLGELPCLEEIQITRVYKLRTVGREFFGITTTTTSSVIAFPKLKKLVLEGCANLKEWEDISLEEDESAAFSVMPCLTVLRISGCDALTALPHRLLRNALSLETLDISDSTTLVQRYENKDGSDWKSLSQNNPRLQLISQTTIVPPSSSVSVNMLIMSAAFRFTDL